MNKHQWACGVTTVPQRKLDPLPRTLQSLANAGFPQSRLFVDGARDIREWEGFGLDVTLRFPAVRTSGNWILSMWELLIRNPSADRFAIFQDDVLFCRNLKAYLDSIPFPERGYLNLYTIPHTEMLFRDKPDGWHEAPLIDMYPSWEPGMRKQQRGRGALGLVFSREGVQALFSTDFMARKVQSPLGWRKIDGGVVEAMNQVDWQEWVHLPSLCQHVGDRSTMGNTAKAKPKGWRGEEFDCMELLVEK